MLWFGPKVEVGKGKERKLFLTDFLRWQKLVSPSLSPLTHAQRRNCSGEGGGGEDALTVKSGFSRKGTEREGERSLKRCQCVSGYWNFSRKENDATYQKNCFS